MLSTIDNKQLWDLLVTVQLNWKPWDQAHSMDTVTSHIPGLESTTFKKWKMGDVKWIKASCLTCWRRNSSSCRCCSIISCCCWILCCICRSQNYNKKLACANNSPGYNSLHLGYFFNICWETMHKKAKYMLEFICHLLPGSPALPPSSCTCIFVCKWKELVIDFKFVYS